MVLTDRPPQLAPDRPPGQVRVEPIILVFVIVAILVALAVTAAALVL